MLAEREKFNQILRDIIDQGTDAWGIDVTAVEVKDIDLPQEMKRAMARQAEAERERRAKVINAEGELQAATKLKDAARLLSSQPASLQLRFLQTASEIAAENNSTTLFPLPIELFGPLKKAWSESEASSDVDEEDFAALEARARLATEQALASSRLGIDDEVAGHLESTEARLDEQQRQLEAELEAERVERRSDEE